jgi:hypothetical protein
MEGSKHLERLGSLVSGSLVSGSLPRWKEKTGGKGKKSAKAQPHTEPEKRAYHAASLLLLRLRVVGREGGGMTEPPPALIAPWGLPATRRTELPLPAAAADENIHRRAGVNDARGRGRRSLGGAFALPCRVLVAGGRWHQRRTGRGSWEWEWDSNRRMSREACE